MSAGPQVHCIVASFHPPLSCRIARIALHCMHCTAKYARLCNAVRELRNRFIGSAAGNKSSFRETRVAQLVGWHALMYSEGWPAQGAHVYLLRALSLSGFL